MKLKIFRKCLRDLRDRVCHELYRLLLLAILFILFIIYFTTHILHVFLHVSLIRPSWPTNLPRTNWASV